MLHNNENENKQLKNCENSMSRCLKSLHFKWDRLFSKQCVQILLNIVDSESCQILTVCMTFVALYSLLPHKEIRFIYFIIPPMNLLSTIGVLRLWTLWRLTHENIRSNLVVDTRFESFKNECEQLSLLNSHYYWLYVQSPYTYGWVVFLRKCRKGEKKNKNKTRKNAQYITPVDAPKAKKNQSKSNNNKNNKSSKSSKISKHNNDNSNVNNGKLHNTDRNNNSDINNGDSKWWDCWKQCKRLRFGGDSEDNDDKAFIKDSSSSSSGGDDAVCGNICSSCGMRNKLVFCHYIVQLLIVSLCFVSFLFSMDRVYVSRFNYWGGYAIRALPDIIAFNYFINLSLTGEVIEVNSPSDAAKYTMAELFLFKNISRANMKKILSPNISRNEDVSSVYDEFYTIYNRLIEFKYEIWYENVWNFDNLVESLSRAHSAPRSAPRSAPSPTPGKHTFYPTKSRAHRNQMNSSDGKTEDRSRSSNNSVKNKTESDLRLIKNELSFMPINCIHIGNSAAISGVTLFLTQKYDPYYHFSKDENLNNDSYATQQNPCNINSKLLRKYVTNTKRDKLAFNSIHRIGDGSMDSDEEDTEFSTGGEDGTAMTEIDHDSVGNDTDKKNARIGFDYLISEYDDIPGYDKLEYGGTIYGLAPRPFWKLFYAPLTPKLYILKKTN